MDGQRWILSVLPAGEEPWKLSAGLCWKGDGGGENLHLCVMCFSSSKSIFARVGGKFF